MRLQPKNQTFYLRKQFNPAACCFQGEVQMRAIVAPRVDTTYVPFRKEGALDAVCCSIRLCVFPPAGWNRRARAHVIGFKSQTARRVFCCQCTFDLLIACGSGRCLSVYVVGVDNVGGTWDAAHNVGPSAPMV